MGNNAPLIAPKEHLHPTGMMFVRTYVTLKILFAPYLVVGLSTKAEMCCVYATDLNIPGN